MIFRFTKGGIVPQQSYCGTPSTAPAVDVVERDDDYLTIVDLPGVKKEDLELSISGTLLSVKGDKKAPLAPPGASPLYSSAFGGHG
jgi:HSP20 family protein